MLIARRSLSISTKNTTGTGNYTLPNGWTAGGCIVDNASRVLQGFYFTSSIMTPALCASTCASQGFTMAGSEVSVRSQLSL
jgi:hypothetical protein